MPRPGPDSGINFFGTPDPDAGATPPEPILRWAITGEEAERLPPLSIVAVPHGELMRLEPLGQPRRIDGYTWVNLTSGLLQDPGFRDVSGDHIGELIAPESTFRSIEQTQAAAQQVDTGRLRTYLESQRQILEPRNLGNLLHQLRHIEED